MNFKILHITFFLLAFFSLTVSKNNNESEKKTKKLINLLCPTWLSIIEREQLSNFVTYALIQFTPNSLLLLPPFRNTTQ